MIEETAAIDRELYLGIVLDRANGRNVFMASTAGGMEIEEVAAKDPNAIIKVHLVPGFGLRPFQAREIAFRLGLEPKYINGAVKFMMALTRAAEDTDASLVEINPFITTTDGRLFALDAKMNFDDNALERHPELEPLRDLDEEDPAETEAAKYALNYVKLDGQIGCMVNGAGLAMATMDIIKLYGSSPANFLDVGGGATKERVTAAFKIILKDPNVEGILVNIFGGIVRCDLIADGVINAVKNVGVKVPVVVRLEGTNADKARETLAQSGLTITPASDLTDAARKVAALAKG